MDDGDAILMAQKLANQLGLGVGISSGANFLGALKAQERLGPDAVVVTVFSDDNKKYLSTDLLREEPMKGDFLTPHIALEAFDAFKRVCYTCCDPVACGAEHQRARPGARELAMPSCPWNRGRRVIRARARPLVTHRAGRGGTSSTQRPFS